MNSSTEKPLGLQALLKKHKGGSDFNESAAKDVHNAIGKNLGRFMKTNNMELSEARV
jgi:hypothetical protein